MNKNIKSLNKILVNTIIASIILLICTYNSSVFATSLTSGGTTITENNNMTSTSSNSSTNDPTVYNANAGSNTYITTDEDDVFSNSTATNGSSKNTNTTNTTNTSADPAANYYDQALVSSTNTITPKTVDVNSIINIVLIVIGVLIIVFAGAILIKLRLNQ